MGGNIRVWRAALMRRRFMWWSAFAAALMSTSGAAQSPPAARSESRGAADVHVLVRVVASDLWTDSGVELAAGDQVQITGWGVVSIDRMSTPRSVRPNGLAVARTGCRFVLAEPSGAPYGLIGNVADTPALDGRGFAVGTRWAGTAPIASTSRPYGRLYLGINHEAVECDRSGYDSWKVRNDTSGAFSAEVFVWHARKGR